MALGVLSTFGNARGTYFHGRDVFSAMKYFSDCSYLSNWKCTIGFSDSLGLMALDKNTPCGPPGEIYTLWISEFPYPMGSGHPDSLSVYTYFVRPKKCFLS